MTTDVEDKGLPGDGGSGKIKEASFSAARGGDFRELLKKRLAEKRSQLGATEESIKKYSAPPAQGAGTGVAGAQGEHRGAGRGVARFQNRLGPPPGGGPVPGRALGARLGPRVDNRRSGEQDEQLPNRGGLLSRVVVEQKTREEVMAEKKASENEEASKVEGGPIPSLLLDHGDH